MDEQACDERMHPTRSLRFSPTPFAVLVGALALGLNLSAAAATSGQLLVINKGDHTLSIVDPTTGKQIGRVDEEGVTGHEVAASPDGNQAFVPIYSNVGVGKAGTNEQVIRVIDLATQKIASTINFGHGVRPHCPVINPKTGLLYVTTEIDQTISIIDPKTEQIVGIIPTGQPQSHMLTISHDGLRGYTCNVGSGTVSVLDLEKKTLLATVKVSPLLQRIAISPDDRWVVTADQTALRLVVIDTKTNAVSESIPVPGFAFGTAFTADGKWLLIALPGIKQVGVMDWATRKMIKRIDVPKSPQEILIRPDQAVAYVSCDASQKVAAITTADWQVEKLIDVGPQADGLAWANSTR